MLDVNKFPSFITNTLRRITCYEINESKNIENREEYKINVFIFNPEVHHVLREPKVNGSLSLKNFALRKFWGS